MNEREKKLLPACMLSIMTIILGLLVGTGIGYMTFVKDSEGDNSYTAYRVCGGWSGKCHVFPKNEWRLDQGLLGNNFILYHKTDPKKWYKGYAWSDHLTKVKLDANGNLAK